MKYYKRFEWSKIIESWKTVTLFAFIPIKLYKCSSPFGPQIKQDIFPCLINQKVVDRMCVYLWKTRKQLVPHKTQREDRWQCRRNKQRKSSWVSDRTLCSDCDMFIFQCEAALEAPLYDEWCLDPVRKTLITLHTPDLHHIGYDTLITVSGVP